MIKSTIFIAFIALSFSACTKKEHCIGMPPPAYLTFQIRHNGTRLSDLELDNLKLFYYQGDIKKYVSDFSRIKGADYDLGIFGTGAVGYDPPIKNLYLQFQNSDIDTIYADYPVSPGSACDPKTTNYSPPVVIKYNNTIASLENSMMTEKPYYVFNKQ